MKYKMMKKHLTNLLKTLSLCFCLCLGLFLISAYAGTAEIHFSDHETVEVGSELNVTMKIQSFDGTSLSDATVMLNYPADILQFDTGTDASGGAGSIRVSGVSNGGGTTELTYNLQFSTLAPGSATISIASSEVYDSAGEVVDISALGTSLVNVNAASGTSDDASLSLLEVSPGQLSPGFSSDVTSYTVTVGSGVSSLSINANASDAQATVSIQNNQELQMGDNTVTVTVLAADGTTTQTYTIVVSKVEGGPEVATNETSATDANGNEVTEGVQLYSRGRTITILNPDESVQVPDGFRSGTIRIDDQGVQGWIPEGTSEPEYCLVYGMNEDGETYFYRYDMLERTIQRFFADPGAETSVSGEEYDALMADYESSVSQNDTRLIVIVVLAAVIFVLIIFCAYLLTKNRALLRSGRLKRVQPGEKVKRHRQSGSKDEAAEGGDEEADLSAGENILRHNLRAESNLSVDPQPGDETQVITRTRRRRRRRQGGYNESALQTGDGETSGAARSDAGDGSSGEEKSSDSFEDLDV